MEISQNAKNKISSASSRVSGVNDSKTGTLRAWNAWRRKRENYWRFLRPGEIVKESFVTSRCYLCPFWLRGEKDRGAEFFEIHLSKWNVSIEYRVSRTVGSWVSGARARPHQLYMGPRSHRPPHPPPLLNRTVERNRGPR